MTAETTDAGSGVHALPDGPAIEPHLQAFSYHRDPLGFLLRARDRYGPVFTMRMAGKEAMVVIGDPALVPILLGADPRFACAGEARRAVLPQASPRSPFGADGSEHEAIRGLMAPALLPDRIPSAGACAGASAKFSHAPSSGPCSPPCSKVSTSPRSDVTRNAWCCPARCSSRTGRAS